MCGPSYLFIDMSVIRGSKYSIVSTREWMSERQGRVEVCSAVAFVFSIGGYSMAVSLKMHVNIHSLGLRDFCAIPLQPAFLYDHGNGAHSMKKIKAAVLKPMITGLSL